MTIWYRYRNPLYQTLHFWFSLIEQAYKDVRKAVENMDSAKGRGLLENHELKVEPFPKIKRFKHL